MDLYLAGPMSSKPDYNYPLFKEAAEELRQRHHKVLNPAELHEGTVPGSQRWEWYIRQDLTEMLNYNVIALLPDWESSNGARLEVTVAHMLGMHVFEIDVKTWELVPTHYGNQDHTGLS